MKKLNNRQKKLYQFLLDKSDSNRFISKDEICYNLRKLYPRFEENSSVVNSTVLRKLRKDISAINGSDEVEKIIIYNLDDGGYKVATKEEAIDFIKIFLFKALRSLKIYWKMRKKVGDNNQLQQTDDALRVVQTFVERNEWMDEKN